MKTIPDDEEWVIPPGNSILSELVSESNKLLANAESGYSHRGGVGDHREEILRDFLTSRLPQSVATCKGIVQDSYGRRTSEIDILIYDPAYRMVIAQADPGRLVLPVESVIVAIEVRTHINKAAVFDTAKTVEGLSKLQRHYDSLGLGGAIDRPPESLGFGARESGPFGCVVPIPVYLLGFEGSNGSTVVSEWEQHDNAPDFVGCLGKYFLMRGESARENQQLEAPATVLPAAMMTLTAHILRAKKNACVPDLLRYFRLLPT